MSAEATTRRYTGREMTYPMLTFTPTTEDPAEERASLARLHANRERLAQEWDRLLAEHLGKWAASYGEGTVVVASDPHELIRIIPQDEIGTAALRHIRHYIPLIL